MTPAAQNEWRKLEALARRPLDIREMLAQNPQRPQAWALEGGGVFLDSSKSLADDAALSALHSLARAAEVGEKLHAQAQGAHVNFTEDRPALHSALRPSASARACPAADVADALRELDRAIQFGEDIRGGKAAASDGRPFARVIHIGIGGSHLGPELLCDALSQNDGPEIRFVANSDPVALSHALRGGEPKSTLVAAVSKSFSTGETLENARAAKSWLESGLGAEKAASHFVAVTANPDAAVSFGVPRERVFTMPDWVGGRCSLWSAASLSAVASIGEKQFRDFLRGGGEMDSHVLDSPPEKNIAVRLALLGVWHCGFLRAQTHCVVAYQHRLRGFARYLQQLTMESNGKRICADGALSSAETGEILWGGEGANDQHSYFQLLAQGTRMIPADFILAARPSANEDAEAHRRLLARALGWSRALMTGRSLEAAESESLAGGMDAAAARGLAAHQECPGNRPTNILLVAALDARALGALTALYEHKTAAQSFIWGVNAFDQWGVESGKKLTGEILSAMASGDLSELDASTRMLISRIYPAD